MSRAFAPRAAVVARFLLLFLPVAVLVIVGGLWMLTEDARARAESLRGRQANHLALLEGLAELRLEPAVGAVREIAVSPSLVAMLDDGDVRAVAAAELTLAAELQAETTIDRVQVFDAGGRERLHLERVEERFRRFPGEHPDELTPQLRERLAALRPRQVALCPVALAVEAGRVAQPPRPILRFATAVLDATGTPRGAVLADLRAATLLSLLARPFVSRDEKTLVADERGFWLVGPREGSEWGFALPERSGSTVATDLPQVWQAISRGDFGHTSAAGGELEHRRLRLDVLARTGWSERTGWDASAAGTSWWVISWLPKAAADEGASGLRRNLAIAVLVVLAVMAVAALGESRSTVARRRAERAARDQLGLMETLGETIASPVFVKNREERYTAVNRAYEELVGLPRAALLGHTDREVAEDPALSLYEKGDREALSGSAEVRYETTVAVEGRHPRQVEVHKRAFADSHGNRLGLVGVVHDITELREAQGRLAASEVRFRAMIEGSLDLIFLLGEEAAVEYANPRAESLMGWSQEELVGRPAIELVHPDDAGLTRRMMNALAEDPGARPRQEVRLASRGGTWLDCEIWAARLAAGSGPAAVLAVAHDIRERKRAQRELADSRARLQRVLEHMPVMLSAVGEDGRYAVWNRECERVTGYSLEDMADEKVGRSMARMLPDPRLLDRVRHDWAAREGEFRDWELEIVCKDGSRKITSWSSIARQFPVAGWRTWSIAVDVTDRRRAERDKAAALETLQSWVGKLQRLNELDDLLHACRNLPEAYAVLEKSLPPLFAADAGQIFRPDSGSDAMTCVLAWGGLGSPSLPRTSCWGLRLGHAHLHGPGASGVVCDHGEDLPGAASICAPLLAQGEVLGLLHLRKAVGETSTDSAWASELQLAQMVAGHLSLRIAALGLRETLEYRSTRDPLTGLFNRRYLEETLTRELHRSERHRRPFALVMIDIDHFKRINDTYGHAVGDIALREVAGALQKGLRSSDVASRWGGEEFVLLMPEATVPPAARRAEELRHAVLALAADPGRGLPPELSISAGVAIYPLHAESSEKLLKAADAALYRAKANGRNRVETAG